MCCYALICRFTPETIGMETSSAVGYLLLEILVILFTLYILAVQTSLTYLDWTAYCGYKYFGWVAILVWLISTDKAYRFVPFIPQTFLFSHIYCIFLELALFHSWCCVKMMTVCTTRNLFCGNFSPLYFTGWCWLWWVAYL